MNFLVQVSSKKVNILSYYWLWTKAWSLSIQLDKNLVQFSHSVVSNFLQPRRLQHVRLPCPSPTPRACSNSCPLSRWCHPTISSSSVIPFSSCLQSFPSIRVFSNESVLHIKWPKYWSFSFSISPFNKYSGLISFRMDWFDLLSVFSNTTVQKHQFFSTQLSLWSIVAVLSSGGPSLISTTAPAYVLQGPSKHQWAVQPFPGMVLKWYRTVH